MSQVLGVTWYRLGATFARRRGGYLSIVLLIGLVGGIAMASVEVGRRTQSSYPTFLASTGPSDLTVSVASTGSGPVAFSPASVAMIARLPHVKRVAALISLAITPLFADGAPNLNGGPGYNVQAVGSADGMWADQDRVTVIEGRMASPDRADEAVVTPSAGIRIGQTLLMGYYTTAQIASKAFGTPRVAPALKVDIRVVGIVELNRQVVEDDVDRAYGFLIFSPALVRAASAVSPGGRVTLAPGAPTLYGLQLDHGERDVLAVEQAFVKASRPGSDFVFNATSRVVNEVELALRPESVAFGAFGAIAGLVALLVGVQAISRQLREDDEDRRVLRALGAGPALTGSDGLIGVLAAVVLGALLAAALAVALSPLAPLGPVRRVYPDGGIAFDWTVLGAGLAVLLGGLGAAAAGLAFLQAPHRLARSTGPAMARTSGLARRARSAGVPVAGVVGVRFALEPGQGRTSVPVRSALMGTVLAVTVVVAALTFAGSLTTLVSHPPLYGWNWDYMFSTTNDVPPQSLRALEPRPRRGRLVRRRSRPFPGRRAVRAQRRGQPPRPGGPARPVRARLGRRQPGRDGLGHPGRTAQAHRRHRVPQRRDPQERPFLHPADPPGGGRARPPSPPSATRASSPATPPWAPGRWSPAPSNHRRGNGPRPALTPSSTARSTCSCGWPKG